MFVFLVNFKIKNKFFHLFRVKTKVFYVIAVDLVKIFPTEVVEEYYRVGKTKFETKNLKSQGPTGRLPTKWKNVLSNRKKSKSSENEIIPAALQDSTGINNN